MKFKTRLILATTLLSFSTFFLVLFFLYNSVIIFQLILTIFLTAIGFIAMYTIKIKEKKKFFKYFIIIFGLIFLLLYFINFHYLNITSKVYYKKIDEREYSLDKFWYSEYIYIEGDDGINVIFVQNGEPNLYIYDLENDLENMETVISTGDIEIKSIHKVLNKPIFTSIRTEEEIIYTDIYEFDVIQETYTLIESYEGEFDVYFEREHIFLVEVEFLGFHSRIFIVENGIPVHYKSVNYDIYNMEYFNNSWFIVLEGNSGQIDRSLAMCDQNFNITEIVIFDLYDYPTIKFGFEHMLVFDSKTTYFINLTDFSYTEYEGIVRYNEYNGYLYRDHLYNYNMTEISNIIYIDDNYYTYGGNLAFAYDSGMIVFDAPYLTHIHTLGMEPTLFIPTYFRHVLGFVSVFGIALSVTFGIYVKPKVKLITTIYHPEKIACPKCKSYNNIVTYPERCLYCNTVYTEKKKI